jgi:hypothetical protein
MVLKDVSKLMLTQSCEMNDQAISTLESVQEHGVERIRFPMDGLLRLLRQPACYCLGVTAMVDSDASAHRNWVGSIAHRCAERSGRKTLWVRGAVERVEVASVVAADPGADPGHHGVGSVGWESVDSLQWRCLSEDLVVGTSAFRQAMAELSELPRLRQRYELIVIDLGGLSTAGMERVGKLCDGVVLLCESGADPSRAWPQRWSRSAKVLRRCLQEGMHFVGAWSLFPRG